MFEALAKRTSSSRSSLLVALRASPHSSRSGRRKRARPLPHPPHSATRRFGAGAGEHGHPSLALPCERASGGKRELAPLLA
jgi:hypothetical protein